MAKVTVVHHPRPAAIPGRGEPQSVRDAWDKRLQAQREAEREREREAEAS
jgi:hypothetical protein